MLSPRSSHCVSPGYWLEEREYESPWTTMILEEAHQQELRTLVASVLLGRLGHEAERDYVTKWVAIPTEAPLPDLGGTWYHRLNVSTSRRPRLGGEAGTACQYMLRVDSHMDVKCRTPPSYAQPWPGVNVTDSWQ